MQITEANKFVTDLNVHNNHNTELLKALLATEL